ncbi:cell division protein FtsQ/DivIB [Chitinophaga deserti]|uniref:cell division protein FtsQ/DivIB n=1 Tax=Chitinophaga deserti TaxID=2164099 RepID=UPI000D6AF0C4|nr:hypothetical protein [Chitinophaga deserti]
MQPTTKTAIKRIATVLLWGGVLAGFAVLLAAAVNDKEKAKCKGIRVSLRGDDRNAFVDVKDVKALITADKSLNPTGKPISQVSLAQLEKIVERDPWIRSAQLFIDNNQLLQVEVEQRDPLARVFTFSGNSFYLDGDGERIPVSDRYSARVPVFTNFPADAVKLRSEDSLLFAQMRDMAAFIATDTFWNAQVEQVVITEDRKFEFIPKLGDHIVYFGEGTDVANKFARLLVFYKEGLSKAGWNTYTRLNVAFRDQVIGTRRDGKSAPPPPMYKDSSAADIAAQDDDDHAAPAATVAAPPSKPAERNPDKKPVKTAAKPAPKKTPKPATGDRQKPRAIYQKPNQRNRN